MEKILILLGPTGVGKTSLSLAIAKKFDMEVISADSVQIYKEFDIGSAKIMPSEREGVVHHGIDIISPKDDFSVSDFITFTKEKIAEILAKGKTPFIVGGTGLYIKSLIEGYNLGGTERHDDFRLEMENLAENEGLEALYKKLVCLSPETAEKIDRHNKVRLIRALEIATFGGERSKIEDKQYEYKVIALTMPREELYERINERTKVMLKNGLMEEVKNLHAKYGDCQPMRAIGYKEVVSYLNGEFDLDKMEELISQHTRNYAKRQITFMKGIENINYYDITKEGTKEKLEEDISKWLN